jgi:wyosine [tRNA(Phe)-imidazoG37] synthetase (radical SAM superfamily)
MRPTDGRNSMNPMNPRNLQRAPHVFGPVPSRRLGLSLGIDLIPPKTCSYNCLYCQLGPTTHKTITEGNWVSAEVIVQEAAERLSQSKTDVATLAGSGEPTLYADIERVIDGLKGLSGIPVALLTNGSLFWREALRRRVMRADIILPTLTSVFEETFQRIHRPHPELRLGQVLSGLGALRQEYRGSLWLEVVLLKGINDSPEELLGLKRAIKEISPDKIQLNTVVRPPSDSRAVALDSRSLEEIKAFFGDAAEVVSEFSFEGRGSHQGPVEDGLVQTVSRRPMRASDAAEVLGLSVSEAGDLLKDLCERGILRAIRQSGETYYARNDEDGKK